MGGVTVFQPQISVVLKKNIGRSNVAGNIAASKRFTGTSRQIDLTPYLGDNGSVVTSKSVRGGSQASGMFAITLADNFAPGELESLYGVIEPMDVIEIRMARDISKYAGAFTKHMPIMMRGFVTRVRRSEAMQGSGEDARPVRRVIITGQDYTKILQINQIAFLPNMVTGQLLLTYFKLFVNYGIGANPNQDASAFISDVIAKAVLPFLADMRSTAQANGVAQGISPIMDIVVDTLVQGGVVSPFGANRWPGGTIYDLLAYYGDIGAWNELFIEDREDAPHLVYRPTPFKDPSGNFIQEPYLSTSSTRPTVNVVTDAELVAIDAERSDEGVANYYWVDNPTYQLVQAPILQSAQSAPKDTFFLSDYPNSSPFLYGFRPMMMQTQQGGRFDGQKQAVFNAQQGDAVSFVAAKRAILMANNRDNVVFEDGSLGLRGNEAIRAGSIVRLVRGAGFTSEYYAHTVQHEFVPFRSYVTTVSFDRGTGFIERSQHGSGADSPYLAEMSMGGVYG